uniref:Uncharacterized protein n=1 Tax=Syphacia muris TaxID=451379 RepID=A0A0N5ADE8_9BILA
MPSSSFIRYSLSRISLPVAQCDLPLQFLDYYPFSEFRLGYIKLADPSDHEPSLESEQLYIGQFTFSSLSGFSFDDHDESLKFIFDDGVVVQKVLNNVPDCKVPDLESSRNICGKCCLIVFFADSLTGQRFRKRFMQDILHAFDNFLKIEYSSREASIQYHDTEPSTSAACSTAKFVSDKQDSNTNKQCLFLRHPSHSDICGSEQESEFSTSKSLSSSRQKIETYKATDSEIPSSPEKDAGSIIGLNCGKINKEAESSLSRLNFLPPGLYIPPRLFFYLSGDLLSPFAKIQTLGSRNLLASVRTHLFKCGENGGLSKINIARELSNPGYWREVSRLWVWNERGKLPDFDFAFNRLCSFLEWTLQTLDFVSDYGRLSVEDLMLCRNIRWHETAETRKKFDQRMREYFINDEELHAVRNWPGILREKTLFDAALLRASYLRVLDLGTMVAEGSFGSWNLRDLFKRLDNITDLTWLNCHLDGDDCPLLQLKNVERLKRLVLHITKFDRNKFQQFFDRFGWSADDEGFEAVEVNAPLERVADDLDGFGTDNSFGDERDGDEFENDRDDFSGASGSVEVNAGESRDSISRLNGTLENTDCGATTVPNDVHLDFAALSFASSLYRSKQLTKRRVQNSETSCKLFDAPKVILMAKSIALNVPSSSLRRALSFVGKRQLDMFSIGLPLELCSNIRPNRTPYKDVIRLLDNMTLFVNQNWEHKDVGIHVMVDYYAPERVVNLINLVARAFPVAEKMFLRLETARSSDKDFYGFHRHMTEYTIPHNLRIFHLSIDVRTYRFPTEMSVLEASNLEEFHLTLSGIHRTLPNENIKEDLFLSELCDMFTSAQCLNKNSQIRVLGLVCKDAQTRLSIACNKLQHVCKTFDQHLKRLILDVRFLGGLSPIEFLRFRDSLPIYCMVEAVLGPEDCKYIDFDRERGEDDCYRSPTRLDEGFDRYLCSDYSDEVVIQFDESSRMSSAVDECSQATGSFVADDNSQQFSNQEASTSKGKTKRQPDFKNTRVLRSGREIIAGPCCSSSTTSRRRSSRKVRQKRLVSEGDESDDSVEVEVSRKRSQTRDTTRKRRNFESNNTSNPSDGSLSSNSEEWSPNKNKKTRRSRRNRRN